MPRPKGKDCSVLVEEIEKEEDEHHQGHTMLWQSKGQISTYVVDG